MSLHVWHESKYQLRCMMLPKGSFLFIKNKDNIQFAGKYQGMQWSAKNWNISECIELESMRASICKGIEVFFMWLTS